MDPLEYDILELTPELPASRRERRQALAPTKQKERPVSWMKQHKLLTGLGVVVGLSCISALSPSSAEPTPAPTVTETVTAAPLPAVTETVTVTAEPVAAAIPTITVTVAVAAAPEAPAASRVAVTPVVEQPVAAPAPKAAAVDVYFAKCDDARAAGAAPLHRGDPGYRTGLDRDDDGIACE